MTQKKKGFLRKLSRGVVAIAKTPRELIRIADQAIDWANDVTDKSGLGKHFSGSSRVGVTRSSGRNGGTNLHYQQNNHSPVVGLGINNQGTPAAFVNNLAVLPLTAPRANFQIDPQARAGRAVNVQQTTVEESDNSDTPVIETNRDNSIATVNPTQLFRRTDDFALAVNVAVQPIFQPDSRALITIQPAAQSTDNFSSRINIESHNLARWQENYGGKPTVSRVLWMYATNQLLPKDRAFVARVLGAGVVDGIRNGEEQTFGRVRAATGAIVSCFEADRAIRERYSQISGARIDMTSMSYAAPALARLATSLIPETPVELGLTISPALVLFGSSRGLRYFVARRSSLNLTRQTTAINPVAKYVDGNSGNLANTAAESFVNPILHQYKYKIANIKTSDLQPTHGINYSKREFEKFVIKIRAEGIQAPIRYVVLDGVKHIVDGHHRLFAARKLNLPNIPAVEVRLPYKGYKSVNDLVFGL